MANEIVSQWKDIPNTLNRYQANVNGEIRSIDSESKMMNRWGFEMIRKFKGRVLKPWTDSNGYLVVYICGEGRREAINIHRLVAYTFIDNPDIKKDVNHIDGNKKNNAVDNLEWCTRKENMEHARKTGLYDNRKSVKGIPKNGGMPVFYNSATEAAKLLGINNRTGISDCAKGKVKYDCGYSWEFCN